ncbi:DUF1329 domain-containing protein [Niveispirillum cyanobacteriorum]|uniref:DUF1329 domain-containing protein n=1 Tax=Niveispirillum cyanobacteriorum TaxID=1612173 RepID=A0A2K9NB49_9PROT|nr:DUF1329 domain-containing protein [Niveispirillum cyanobacteriorum]AUN30334.1 DUF1329 domain-containing protein [Niveispirillum cyanobacteriorum]GGE55636.1 hypothetical protein GCM10011317_12160 [Niveispirillum cyanobacteriorum]
MFRMKSVLLGGAIALAFSLPVLAQSAADLGKTLTPMGAIKAGNADGTIPEWTGGITKPPANWQPGTIEVDPFPEDKVKFTITAANMAQYEDKLPEGLKALLKRYPSYKMNVYPTRRSASYPDRIYKETIANATRAKLADGGNGVEGAKEGVPFPIPKEGVEAVWNHLLRYRGEATERNVGQVNPQTDGSYTLIMLHEQVKYLYQAPGGAPANTSLYFLQEVTSPARLAGEILLVHETINQVKEPRSAWTYNPGQRRVRRAPNVAYDNPGTASDGLRTTDNFDVYSGAPDRYDWKLIGKKEMYVPYNSYKLHSKDTKYDDIVKPGHINQDLARYELHRVWVVEATLKQGTSHIYAKRRFYIDEDSWQILVADHLDARGEMWRVAESHPVNYYSMPTFWSTLDALYDLQSGRYTAIGLDNQEAPYKFDAKFTDADFSPDSLRRAGVR